MTAKTYQPPIEYLYRVLWDMLPDTLTHVYNLGGADWMTELKSKLRMMGWNWRDDDHVEKFLICAQRRGVMQVEGYCIARDRPLPQWPEARR